MEEMTALQEKIDAARPVGHRQPQVEMAMDALRCPPNDCQRRQACRAVKSAASP